MFELLKAQIASISNHSPQQEDAPLDSEQSESSSCASLPKTETIDTLSPEDIITQILLDDHEEDAIIPSEIFWEAPAIVHWFRERGYTLYKRVYFQGSPTEWTIPSLPFNDVLESSYPYAGHDTTASYPDAQPLRTAELTVSP